MYEEAKQLVIHGRYAEADKVILETLERQIPTEPIVDEKTDNWTCPNCFDEYSDMERYKFCPNCGQAIKHKGDIVEDEPEVCSCYREQTVVIYEDEKFKTTIISKCLGTKEQEICSCNGDKNKCNFP